MSHRDVAHLQVLAAAREITQSKGRNELAPEEVVHFLRRRGSPYAESTIRTHIVSRCCKNAPENHAVRYEYFERVGHGLYRILGGVR